MIEDWKTRARDTLASFDEHQIVNSAFLRLLLTLDDKTTILVRSQARPKRYNMNKANVLFSSLMDVQVHEWFGSLLRFQLDTLTQRAFNDSSLFRNVFNNFHSQSSLNVRSNIVRDLYIATMTNIKEKEFYMKFRNTLNINISRIMYNTHNSLPKLWFWDTSLPVDIKNTNDCNILYNHDPTTTSLIPSMSLLPKWTARYDYMERIIEAKTSKIQKSYWRDSFNLLHARHTITKNYTARFSNQNESKEFDDAGVTEKYNGSQTKSVMSDEIKETDNAGDTEKYNGSQSNDIMSDDEIKEAYFDGFASAYALPDLQCDDLQHTGQLTEKFEVTQILNLLCNQHLPSNQDLCCNSE